MSISPVFWKIASIWAGPPALRSAGRRVGNECQTDQLAGATEGAEGVQAEGDFRLTDWHRVGTRSVLQDKRGDIVSCALTGGTPIKVELTDLARIDREARLSCCHLGNGLTVELDANEHFGADEDIPLVGDAAPTRPRPSR